MGGPDTDHPLKARLAETIRILERLVAFEVYPGQSNLELLGFVTEYLGGHGITAELAYSSDGERANLLASIGPARAGGVVLSGHTDVVPVEGQDWSRPPFMLTRDGERLVGRGAVDMKGFLACVMASVPAFVDRALDRPIHLAFSHDEESGSIGAPALASLILERTGRPEAVIVGEPTEMAVIAGHKGGYEMRTRFEGVPGHSSDPARGVSAIAFASRFVAFLDELGHKLAAAAPADSAFEPACSTLNVGTIHGGAGRSIIAADCTLDWELRVTPPDDGKAVLASIDAFLETVLAPEMRARHVGASITTTRVSAYPALAFDPASPAVALARELTGRRDVRAVPFGCDAGCFHAAGLPSVILGPGSIDQAHKAHEFIETEDLVAGLRLLERLRDRQSVS